MGKVKMDLYALVTRHYPSEKPRIFLIKFYFIGLNIVPKKPKKAKERYRKYRSVCGASAAIRFERKMTTWPSIDVLLWCKHWHHCAE